MLGCARAAGPARLVATLAPCAFRLPTSPLPSRSGYTAKVAGTEQGVTEPEATFSACFGSAFLMWHPVREAGWLSGRVGAGQPAPEGSRARRRGGRS